MQEMHELHEQAIVPGTYTVPVTLDGGQPTIAIPRGLGFDGVQAVQLEKRGNALVLRAVPDEQPSWESLADEPSIDLTPSREPLGDINRFLEGFK